MDGTLLGTDSEFNKPGAGALTDYGIGGALDTNVDGASGNGLIFRWNEPTNERAPIANGDNEGLVLSEKGRAFAEAYNYKINARLVSIEVSGCSGECTPNYCCGDGVETDVTAEQIDSIGRLVAYYHDQAGQSYKTFPADPKTGVETCLEHSDFSDKGCPYPKLMAKRELYLARAREIMEAAQTGKEIPPYKGGSQPGDGQPGTPSDGQPGLFEVNDKIKVNTGASVNLRSQPTINSTVVAELANETELCVQSAGKVADGYTWYQVKTVQVNQQGYIASSLCQRVARNGCGTGLPRKQFSIGDRIKTTTSTKLVGSPGNASTPAPTGELKETDKIVQASRGAAETPIAYARNVGAAHLDQVIAYVNEAYRLAKDIGFDAAIIVSQSALETDNWRGEWWVNRLNPAGLGITSDSAQDQVSQTFSSGVAAARAQLAHMHAYVYGDTRSLPSDLVGTDDRYNAVFTSNFDGTVTTINDLSSKWATVADYATRIVNRGNDIYGQVLAAALPPAPAGTKIADLTEGTELCVTGDPTSADGYD